MNIWGPTIVPGNGKPLTPAHIYSLCWQLNNMDQTHRYEFEPLSEISIRIYGKGVPADSYKSIRIIAQWTDKYNKPLNGSASSGVVKTMLKAFYDADHWTNDELVILKNALNYIIPGTELIWNYKAHKKLINPIK